MQSKAKNDYALRRRRKKPTRPVPKSMRDAGSGVELPLMMLLGVPSSENHVLAPLANPPVKVMVSDSVVAPNETALKVMLGPS